MSSECLLDELATACRALNALSNITFGILILTACVLIHLKEFLLLLFFLVAIHGLFFLSIHASLAWGRVWFFTVLILRGLRTIVFLVIVFILRAVILIGVTTVFRLVVSIGLG
jgi:hypothetical protein